MSIRSAFQTPQALRVIAVAAVLSISALPALAQQSAARVWDEKLLGAIRLDKPRPPVHARNLYHVSAAMYDAWAAYDVRAGQLFHHERATAVDIEAARAETISYAASRMIKHRYAAAVGAATTIAAVNAQMTALGYDPNNTSTVGNSPAALGNRIFETIRNATLNDGANEPGNYAANNGYVPLNAPLIFQLPGATMAAPSHWQPLAFDYYVEQNGIVVGAAIQAFVCPHWGGVTTFGLTGPHPNNVYLDPGPPSILGTATDADFKDNMVEVIRLSSYLTPTDNVVMDIGPGGHHNNSLGLNDGTGYPLNPVTGQPYAPNPVLRGDYARCLAEFWADGPNSETPPGHWNVVANLTSDHPDLVKCIGGTASGGPLCNRLEWDVKLYLALNGAEHDAAVACWGAKGYYDSVRPLSAIRYMCQMGQSTSSSLPRYHPQGIPLEAGLIELITAETIAPGGRHAHLVDYDNEGNVLNNHINDIAVRSWNGQPANPATQIGDVGWILGTRWMPYQARTFVTPPFAGYYSGHSTYSRSAAEVLAHFTGSEYFPGGFASYTLPTTFLTFEDGPTQPVSLQWAKFYDAADEAGISRIYGGIHPRMDDRTGRLQGHIIGPTAFYKALSVFKACPADIASQGGAPIPDAQLTVDDLIRFLTDFFAGTLATADLASLGGTAIPDGQLTVDDLVQFLSQFFAGCP